MFSDAFWTPSRLAGLVIVLGVLIPLIPGIGVLIFGKVRASEAMFSDLQNAVGHVTSFRIMAGGWAVFMLFTLAGFMLFAMVLWEEGARRLVVLSITAVVIHTVFVTLEVSFHMSVMTWAIRQLESGNPVPDIVLQMRHWLNFWLQVFSNPLLLLSYIGFGVAILNTGIVPAWVGWGLIGWGAIWLFFPLPLLIYPIPVIFGIILLVKG